MPYTKYTWFTARDEEIYFCLKNCKGLSSINNSTLVNGPEGESCLLTPMPNLYTAEGESCLLTPMPNLYTAVNRVGYFWWRKKKADPQAHKVLACRSAIAHHQHTTTYKSPLRNPKIQMDDFLHPTEDHFMVRQGHQTQVEEALLMTKMRTEVKTGAEGRGSRVISTRSMTIQRGPK